MCQLPWGHGAKFPRVSLPPEMQGVAEDSVMQDITFKEARSRIEEESPRPKNANYNRRWMSLRNNWKQTNKRLKQVLGGCKFTTRSCSEERTDPARIDQDSKNLQRGWFMSKFHNIFKREMNCEKIFEEQITFMRELTDEMWYRSKYWKTCSKYAMQWREEDDSQWSESK